MTNTSSLKYADGKSYPVRTLRNGEESITDFRAAHKMNQKNQTFLDTHKFTIAVMADPSVTPSGFRLAVALLECRNNNDPARMGLINPGTNKLRKMTTLRSVSSVDNARKSLMDAGWFFIENIKTGPKENATNTYTPNWPKFFSKDNWPGFFAGKNGVASDPCLTDAHLRIADVQGIPQNLGEGATEFGVDLPQNLGGNLPINPPNISPKQYQADSEAVKDDGPGAIALLSSDDRSEPLDRVSEHVMFQQFIEAFPDWTTGESYEGYKPVTKEKDVRTARIHWKRAREKSSFAEIMAGVEKYKSMINRYDTTTEFVLKPATWLAGSRWEDEDAPQTASQASSLKRSRENRKAAI